MNCVKIRVWRMSRKYKVSESVCNNIIKDKRLGSLVRKIVLRFDKV